MVTRKQKEKKRKEKLVAPERRLFIAASVIYHKSIINDIGKILGKIFYKIVRHQKYKGVIFSYLFLTYTQILDCPEIWVFIIKRKLNRPKKAN